MDEAAVMLEMMPIIQHEAARLSGTSWADREDLVGEASLLALQAIRSWDPEGTYALPLWVRLNVRGDLVDYLRGLHGRRGSAKHEHGNRLRSLDAPLAGAENVSLGDTIAHEESGYEAVERRLGAEQAVARLEEEMEGWTEREAEHVRTQADPEVTLRALGARYGVTEARACQVRSKGNERARRAMRRWAD